MEERIRLARSRFNPWLFLGLALLVPPLLCWLAIVVGIAGLEFAWELLGRLSNAEQLMFMLISPMFAALMGGFAIRRLKRADATHAAMCRLMIVAGMFFAMAAILASLRNS